MKWTIAKILNKKFAIKLFTFLCEARAEALNSLQGLDLNIGLKGASNIQKLLVLSGIKDHLNHFHRDNQHETFDSLNLIGTTFEEVMSSPEIRLNRDSMSIYFFSNTIFDSLLTDRMVYLKENLSSEEGLLNSITNSGDFLQTEKAFLSVVILAEPELILRKNNEDKAVFQNITKELIEQAQHNIAHEPSMHHIIMQESFLQAIFGNEVNLNNLFDAIFHEITTHQREINISLLETFLNLLNKEKSTSHAISDKLKIYPSKDSLLSKDIPNDLINHKVIQYLDGSTIINYIQVICEQQNDYAQKLGHIPIIVD